MEIEKATPAHLEEIIRINKAFDIMSPGFMNEYRTQDMIDLGCFYIVKEDDEVVGAMCLTENYDLMTVYTIAVDEGHRRRGVGRALIEFAVDEGKRRGDTTLEVTSNKLFKTKDFYLRCGFALEADYGDGYLFSMRINPAG
jgi:GNAT superfamily N-acetyltransferase